MKKDLYKHLKSANNPLLKLISLPNRPNNTYV